MSDSNQGSGQGGQNLLVDGSFESAAVGNGTWTTLNSVGGWRSDTGIEVWGKGFILNASDGKKVMELDADRRDSRVWQDVETQRGAEYEFSFDYAQRPNTAAATNTIEVWWNGELVGTVEPGSTAWNTASFKLVGTGGKDRIEFREQGGDNDSYGGVIDNAALVMARAPSEEDDEAGKDPNNDDVKHDGRDHGDGDHNDDGHDDNGKGSGDDKDDEADESKGKGKGKDDDKDDEDKGKGKGKGKDDEADESKGKGKGKDDDDDNGKDPNDDDDKHDGRDHGDGDHNDDGHDDNGKGSGKEDGDDDDIGPTLTLATADATDASASQELTGSDHAEKMAGGAGNDHLRGKAGDDVIRGDGVGSFTVPLEIKVSLSGTEDPAAVEVVVRNVPTGATLSAGKDNGDGSWSVSGADIAGLEITSPDVRDFTLKVTAIAVDGGAAPVSAELHVSIEGGQDDVIEGGKGNDELTGDAGDDMLYGGSKPSDQAKPAAVEATWEDNDVVSGGEGNDVVYGNHGDDVVSGDDGDDWVSGGKGNDAVSGGEGNDKVYGNSGDDKVSGGAGDDEVHGGKGNDVLSDGDGNDAVNAGSGDDRIMVGEGDDDIRGGSGFDTLDFSDAKQGVSVTMSKGVAEGMGYDTFNSIEGVVGSDFNDFVFGSTKDNVINGGAGDDVIRGGRGNDTMTGGAGDDTFLYMKSDVVLRGEHSGVDVITDFGEDGHDVLDVRDLLKGQSYGSIEEVLSVKDDGQSSSIYARIGDDMVQVAVLENFTGYSVSDMLKDGMLLA